MKRTAPGLAVLGLILLTMLAAGCAVPAAVQPVSDKETMYQVSTFNALSAGVYEGSATFATLKQHGDAGLGTFDALDGEMIALDGVFYQVTSDGTVRRAGDNMTTPFAAVTFFEPDLTVQVANLSGLGNLSALLDARLPDNNSIYALEIPGRFAYVKVRSVPAQEKPYPPLTEAVKSQSVYERRDVDGTIVAVRFPDYMAGVNVAGYHYHFISDDRQFGGHLLDVTVVNGTAMADLTGNFTMVLPVAAEGLDISKTNASAVKAIEQ